VKLSVPKTTIAAYLGTITETLSRSLKKLQDEGIIRVNGKSIFVNDMKRLKDLAR
jgi:CRP/FNR family transcriptional regulator